VVEIPLHQTAEWLLEFSNVHYSYPGMTQPAIDGLSLRIPRNRRCASIGQNGCGKTTLFLLANGLCKPQQGKIFWNGEQLRYDRTSLTQLRQHIGLVFQNPEQQVVATTVEEDISYGLYNLGLTKEAIAQRVEQVLAEFDLTKLATTPIHHLSLGQKKRVSLADVMVLQPQLLLLDEPTAYLDRLHQRQLIAELQIVHAAGTTILMATHDLDLVYRWADWVFVLDQGKLVLQGTPQDVFTRKDCLEELQLGVPIVLELLAEIDALIDLPKFQSQLQGGAVSTARLKAQIFERFRYPIN